MNRPVVAVIPPDALVIPVEELMLPTTSRFAVGVFPIPTFLLLASTSIASVLTVRFPVVLTTPFIWALVNVPATPETSPVKVPVVPEIGPPV